MKVPGYVGMFEGRDWLTVQDWTQEELKELVKIALDLKKKKYANEPHEYLKGSTLFMLFYNRSLRTRNSFEAGMFQLGGHAHFLSPNDVYTPVLPGDDAAYTTERIADVARVLASYGEATAIRIYGKHAKWEYGRGHKVITEFAKWSKRADGKKVPIINMEDDVYHPCQAMADIQALWEKYNGNLEGKKFVMSWAYSGSVEKPLAVPQSAILVASKFGMDVVLAHPKGFELDDKILEMTKKNADQYGGSFEIVNDMDEAVEGADVVYAKSWGVKHFMRPFVPEPDFEKAKELFEKNKDWIMTQERMDKGNKGVYYMHCLPADRNQEVTDEVLDGPQSIVFLEAENRLHAQKAIMVTIMGHKE